MKLAHLKRVRIAVSSAFFILTGWLFLDFTESIPPSWVNGILFLQFVPSLTKFVVLTSLSAIGFMVVTLLTLLFGRIYCSTICPLGTLQDVIAFFSRRLIGHGHHLLTKPFRILRNSILLLTVVVTLAGSILVLNLLDPFSAFGRITTTFARPLLLAANNGVVYLLESTRTYLLDPAQIRHIDSTSVIVPFIMLALLTWMSMRYGRLYCNTICPVGALLALVSRSSLYKLAINATNCIGCKLCEEVCKSGCIDRSQKSLDFSRCVSCYNCLAVCPKDGLGFVSTFGKKLTLARAPTDYKRRKVVYDSWLLIAGGLGATTTGSRRIVSTRESTVALTKTLPLAPPGAGSIQQFTERCTACSLCVSACPSQVLTPAFLEYGFAGIMQPRMDYRAGFCNYECTTCAQVCPSGALLPASQEQKKITQLGTAKFVKDNCIVYTEEKDCGACSEHCPTKAVRMVPYKYLAAPEVKEEYCIGCGGCEYACPTKPFKAIYVDGKAVHSWAKKPEVKKLEQNTQDEFPF